MRTRARRLTARSTSHKWMFKRARRRDWRWCLEMEEEEREKVQSLESEEEEGERKIEGKMKSSESTPFGDVRFVAAKL